MHSTKGVSYKRVGEGGSEGGGWGERRGDEENSDLGLVNKTPSRKFVSISLGGLDGGILLICLLQQAVAEIVPSDESFANRITY